MEEEASWFIPLGTTVRVVLAHNGSVQGELNREGTRTVFLNFLQTRKEVKKFLNRDEDVRLKAPQDHRVISGSEKGKRSYFVEAVLLLTVLGLVSWVAFDYWRGMRVHRGPIQEVSGEVVQELVRRGFSREQAMMVVHEQRQFVENIHRMDVDLQKIHLDTFPLSNKLWWNQFIEQKGFGLYRYALFLGIAYILVLFSDRAVTYFNRGKEGSKTKDVGIIVRAAIDIVFLQKIGRIL